MQPQTTDRYRAGESTTPLDRSGFLDNDRSGAPVVKGRKNLAHELNPKWRHRMKSAAYNEFTSLAFFYDEIGYTKIGSFSKGALAEVMRRGTEEQGRKLRNRFKSILGEDGRLTGSDFPDLWQSSVSGSTEEEQARTFHQHRADLERVVAELDLFLRGRG